MTRAISVAVAIFVAALSLLGCAANGGGATGVAGSGAAGTGGNSGTAGTSGSAGTGDSSGTGGSVGPTGSAGTSGAAGTGNPAGAAGATGTAGTTGVAGTGGSSGGRGGATGGRGGAAGSAVGGRGGAAGSAAGGRGGTAGSAAGGRGGTAGSAAGGRGGTTGTAGTGGALAHFSFFVTSIGALRTLSGSQNGFGGDLSFGESGDGAGLRGADKICATIAETSMPGAGAKGWHAFLSAPATATTPVVNAIERIGSGPWYDRMGRLFSANLTNLMATRPTDADPAIQNDFPNENGVPNHSDGAPGCTGNSCPDNHDMLTGTGTDGKLYTGGNTNNPTCSGWTTTVGSAGRPRVGHSWPRGSTGGSAQWMSSLDEAGCAAGVNLQETGGPILSDPTVGSGGGYGGFYCFAMTP